MFRRWRTYRGCSSGVGMIRIRLRLQCTIDAMIVLRISANRAAGCQRNGEWPMGAMATPPHGCWFPILDTDVMVLMLWKGRCFVAGVLVRIAATFRASRVINDTEWPIPTPAAEPLRGLLPMSETTNHSGALAALAVCDLTRIGSSRCRHE